MCLIQNDRTPSAAKNEYHISFGKELTARHSIPIGIYNRFSLVYCLRHEKSGSNALP